MKDKSFHASYQEKQTTVQREREKERGIPTYDHWRE